MENLVQLSPGRFPEHRGGPDLLSGHSGQRGPICWDLILEVDLLRFSHFSHSVIEVSQFLVLRNVLVLVTL